MSKIEDRTSEALATRLKHDHPESFDEDTWLDDTFDKYYPDETFVDLVVLQIAQTLCSEDNLTMSAAAKRQLANTVSLSSNGQDAVDAIVEAHEEASPAPRAVTTGNQLLAEHLMQVASLLNALPTTSITTPAFAVPNSKTERASSRSKKKAARKRSPRLRSQRGKRNQ